MTPIGVFPILPPSGDDPELYSAWKHAEQRWLREVEAMRAWVADPCEATLNAMHAAETVTNGAVYLLFEAHRDAERRETKPAA